MQRLSWDSTYQGVAVGMPRSVEACVVGVSSCWMLEGGVRDADWELVCSGCGGVEEEEGAAEAGGG